MSIKDLLAGAVMLGCVVVLSQHLGVQHILHTVGMSTAPAPQRTIYDASGRAVGHVTTDSQGTVTVYDTAGRVVSRTSRPSTSPSR
jgi:YD repeat-containing protein